MFQIFPTKLPPEQVGRRRFDMDSPISDAWLAYARPMCALSLRDDIDGRDSLDGYRNRSRYYQGIAHEVPIRAVAATVMSVQCHSRRRRATSKSGHARMPPKADVNSDTRTG